MSMMTMDVKKSIVSMLEEADVTPAEISLRDEKINTFVQGVIQTFNSTLSNQNSLEDNLIKYELP